jgi:hypothetical protein
MPLLSLIGGASARGFGVGLATGGGEGLELIAQIKPTNTAVTQYDVVVNRNNYKSIFISGVSQSGTSVSTYLNLTLLGGSATGTPTSTTVGSNYGYNVTSAIWSMPDNTKTGGFWGIIGSSYSGATSPITMYVNAENSNSYTLPCAIPSPAYNWTTIRFEQPVRGFGTNTLIRVYGIKAA